MMALLARAALELQGGVLLACVRHGLACGLVRDELAGLVCRVAQEAGRILDAVAP